jgi:hypothetical protein
MRLSLANNFVSLDQAAFAKGIDLGKHAGIGRCIQLPSTGLPQHDRSPRERASSWFVSNERYPAPPAPNRRYG